MEKNLYLSALSILRNKEDAKDALQEAIYLAYKEQDTLKEKCAFKAWITKIVINESYKIYNRRKRFIDISESDNLCFQSADNDDLHFFDIISHLKKSDKTIIILRFYNDCSIEEISNLLKMPLSTVKSRLYRALKKIKNEMEDD